jgi:hypothetical protein
LFREKESHLYRDIKKNCAAGLSEEGKDEIERKGVEETESNHSHVNSCKSSMLRVKVRLNFRCILFTERKIQEFFEIL